ncbi:MAG: hypothetical protein AB1942_19990 [Pseudomonadota bacterium]
MNNTLDIVRQGAGAARQLRQQRRAHVLDGRSFQRLLDKIHNGLAQSLAPDQPGLQAVRELRYQARYDVLTGPAFERFLDEIEAAFARMLGSQEPPAQPDALVLDEPGGEPEPTAPRSVWGRMAAAWGRMWREITREPTYEEWADRQW